MIQLEQLHKSYTVDGRQIAALKGVDLHVQPGEVFGVIGASGAGKSTLLRVINLLERPDSGRVVVAGQDLQSLDGAGLRAARQRIAMIFQHFNLLGSRTVAQNVGWPMRIAGWDSPRMAARVNALLARVGLTEHANKYPAQLSGGQKQRVGIARALALEPQVLLCDEATSALDPETTRSILDLLAELNDELKLSIVLITHEMDVVRRICDGVAVLDDGRIVEEGPVSQVFLHPRSPTARRFVQAAEQVDEGTQRDDFAHVQGQVWRLTFLGDRTYEPLLGEVARHAKLDFGILAGRIDRIKRVPYGQLTIAISAGDLAAARQLLATRGVQVEELRA
ncbi:D-methionine transport system ATP-binding protein [Roseateles sp. YR242]|uniref:methionine ABC transporter ATP-binding protein n=1 Tax=Roseateles sp. YR242 TaxID=1855305 RepID=UPI0008AC135B|nr:methionine ABC transporter ATP-binding protein [Roseateles sp. YR242]SEL33254.1 D-methionine transport system ATP-binding protein [Roseateles sp. YR242]